MTRLKRLTFVSTVVVLCWLGFIQSAGLVMYRSSVNRVALMYLGFVVSGLLSVLAARTVFRLTRNTVSVSALLASALSGMVVAPLMTTAMVRAAWMSGSDALVRALDRSTLLVFFPVVFACVMGGSYWKQSRLIRTTLLLISSGLWMAFAVVRMSGMRINVPRSWGGPLIAFEVTWSLVYTAPIIVALGYAYWRDRHDV